MTSLATIFDCAEPVTYGGRQEDSREQRYQITSCAARGEGGLGLVQRLRSNSRPVCIRDGTDRHYSRTTGNMMLVLAPATTQSRTPNFRQANECSTAETWHLKPQRAGWDKGGGERLLAAGYELLLDATHHSRPNREQDGAACGRFEY